MYLMGNFLPFRVSVPVTVPSPGFTADFSADFPGLAGLPFVDLPARGVSAKAGIEVAKATADVTRARMEIRKIRMSDLSGRDSAAAVAASCDLITVGPCYNAVENLRVGFCRFIHAILD